MKWEDVQAQNKTVKSITVQMERLEEIVRKGNPVKEDVLAQIKNARSKLEGIAGEDRNRLYSKMQGFENEVNQIFAEKSENRNTNKRT